MCPAQSLYNLSPTPSLCELSPSQSLCDYQHHLCVNYQHYLYFSKIFAPIIMNLDLLEHVVIIRLLSMTSLIITNCIIIYSIYYTVIVSCHMIVLSSYYYALLLCVLSKGDLLTPTLRENIAQVNYLAN